MHFDDAIGNTMETDAAGRGILTDKVEDGPSKSSFKQDTYKKSLRVLNQSSIALPSVKSKLKGQASTVVKATRGALVDQSSTLELIGKKDSTSVAMLQAKQSMNNNSSSLITAGGSSELAGDSIDKTVANNSMLLMGTSDSLLASGSRQEQNPVGASNKRQTGGSLDPGAASAIFRNSSTVEKPRGSQNASKILDLQRRFASNSTALMEPLRDSSALDLRQGANQSTRNLPTSKVLVGDYTTSVNVLPVIGSEVSLEPSQNTSASRINSKVELTKKDIQNFLVNGSVSKEFIQTNKKELQKFIKSQARSTSDYFRGYKEYAGKKNGDLGYESAGSAAAAGGLRNSQSSMKGEGVSLERRLVGSSTIHIDRKMPGKKRSENRGASQKNNLRSQRLESNTSAMVFPNDVKLEHKFKGESSHVSNRVLETWINETLVDAYHLDIPGVLTKPEHKLPTSRYGIDRQTLVNAGISTEEVDRIYRSLFVYSVGFFELLKKILSTTHRNYQIITSIWKVFQVLLEYCCKTDYRILIAEITDKHQQEMSEIERLFKAKIDSYIATEKVMKQNMETMRNYNDQLEKERATEKQLRLKLEEEYMQNTKNHEEEVKLRLKFEGKFNTMHDTHRELEIRHNRVCIELSMAQRELARFENEAKDRSQEIIDLQKARVEQDTLIASLKEYKQITEKDLKKKVMTLRNAEQQRARATENYEMKRYEVQESAKDLNDVKTKMEVQTQEIEHLQAQLAAQKLEKEETELARIKVTGEYERIKIEFEERVGKIETLTGKLKAEEQVTGTQRLELETLRKKSERLEKQYGKLSVDHTEGIEKKKFLTVDLSKVQKELLAVQQQLKKMNKDRHRLMDELRDMTELSLQHEQQRDNALVTIENLRAKLKQADLVLQNVRMEAFRREEEHSQHRYTLQQTIKDHLADLDFKKSQIEQFEQALRRLQSDNSSKTLKNEQLDSQVIDQIEKIASLTQSNRKLGMDLEDTRAELTQSRANQQGAEDRRIQALNEKNVAEEVSKTFQETVKSLQRRAREEREYWDSHNETVFLTLKVENERNMMHAEEIVSRFSEMQTELAQALDEKARNRAMIADYANLQLMLSTVQSQRDQVIKELEAKKQAYEHMEAKIVDKDAAIEHQKELRDEAIKDLKSEHNVEVNELEQKIQKVRVEIASLKTQQMKKSREDQQKVTELMKQLKAVQASPNSKSPGKSPGKKAGLNKKGSTLMDSLVANKQVQTDPMKPPSKLKNKPSSRKVKKVHSKDRKPETSRPNELGSGLKSREESRRKSSQNEDASEISLMPETEKQSSIKVDQDSSSGSRIDYSEAEESSEVDQDEDDGEVGVVQKTQRSRGGHLSTHESAKKSQHKLSSKESEAKLKAMTSEDREKLKNERVQKFMQWLVDEERLILEKVEKAADQGENVHPNQLKVWRAEMRVPAMYQYLKLTDEQLQEVEERQAEQAEYFEERAIRKLEEGSAYSSDFEDISESDYVTTDGEGESKVPTWELEKQNKANIKVIRGEESAMPSPRGSKPLAGGERSASQIIVDRVTVEGGDQDKVVSDYQAQADQKPDDGNTLKTPVDPAKSFNESDDTSLGVRKSAADKLIHALRAQSARRKRDDADRNSVLDDAKRGSSQTYTHEIDEQIPVTQYMIMKAKDGRDVYKRKVKVHKRVKKERSESYFEEKRRALSARAQERPASKEAAQERRKVKFQAMFQNFAANYAQTLDTLIEQSKKYLRLKAQNRRKIKGPSEVDNISGRERHHFLIQQMKESSSWQIHLAKLKDELVVQEDKWDHREDERLAIEAKKEEIRILEEEIERERSLERRRKMTIVREDLEQKKAQVINVQRIDPSAQGDDDEEDFSARGGGAQGSFLTATHFSNPAGWADTSQAKQGEATPSVMHHGGASIDVDSLPAKQPLRMPNDEQLSVWSEEAMVNALSKRDAQNPQGDEEELKESQQLQQVLQDQQAQRQERGLIDNELQEMTKGGVAAINRISAQQRTEQQNLDQERQAQAQTRAHDKDIVLAQQSRQQNSNQAASRKRPAKLGPSTIRTLIRQADSRV